MSSSYFTYGLRIELAKCCTLLIPNTLAIGREAASYRRTSRRSFNRVNSTRQEALVSTSDSSTEQQQPQNVCSHGYTAAFRSDQPRRDISHCISHAGSNGKIEIWPPLSLPGILYRPLIVHSRPVFACRPPLLQPFPVDRPLEATARVSPGVPLQVLKSKSAVTTYFYSSQARDIFND